MNEENPAVFGVADAEYKAMRQVVNDEGFDIDRLTLQETVDRFRKQMDTLIESRSKFMPLIYLQDHDEFVVDAPPVEFWRDGQRLDENGNWIGLIRDFTQGKDYK